MSTPYTLAPQAFPDYPVADLPAMPDGFRDVSWRHDMAPTIQSAAQRLNILLDYADPAQREIPGARFLVQHLDADGGPMVNASALETDDWAEVLAFLANAETYA